MRAEWWKFWNPMSGFKGGLIMGAVISAMFIIGGICYSHYAPAPPLGEGKQ